MTRLAVLLVAAVALLAAAQPASTQTAARMHRVGVLWTTTAADPLHAQVLGALRAGLAEGGLVEGRNLTLEHRHAAGHLDRFPALAAELVQTKPDVILAASPLSIRAVRAATASIPIVMINGDPGMFVSLARPGGNITGLVAFQAELAGKQVELLKEAVPKLGKFAVLRNPTQPVHTAKLKEAEAVARALKLAIHVVEAQAPDDFEPAFVAMTREGVGGLVVFADGTYFTNRARIAELALRHGLPAVFGSAGAAEAGGLISYLPNREEAYRRAASYIVRILKGAHAGDLPIEQPTRFELSMNLKTARALRLTLPQALLVRADKIIE